MAAQQSERVMITLIISVAVAFVVVVVGLVLVAVLAGDVVGLSLAIGGTLTAIAGLVAKFRGGSTSGGTP